MRSIHAFGLVICLLLLALVAGCGGGGTDTGKISGKVLNNARVGVAQATVTVQGTDISAKTAADGSYLLIDVPVGVHTLTISMSGFTAATVQVSVTTGVTATLADVVLTAVARKWTVLVYLNAKNDLESYSILNLNQMEAVADNPAVTVAVEMGRLTSSNPTAAGTWVGTKRFTIVHDNDPNTVTSFNTSPVVEDLATTNMGSAAALTDFISWGKRTFPAEHYMVVLWDHGNGWRTGEAVAAMKEPRAISWDDEFGTNISGKDLPIGLASSTPTDIVAMDACLMQMLEVGYQIRNNCSFIVASEENVPGPGYPYDKWLAPLAANPAMSPRDFASTIVNQTVQYYLTRESLITHSAVDTAQLPQLATAVDNFAGALMGITASETTALVNARDGADCFGSPYYTDYKDLYDYADQ
ncbi:MAG: clostripain-related cysteine peptidase, partial [bacterium]